MGALPEQAVDSRVLDHMVREDVEVQSCGCQSINEGRKWRLCPYHDGMNDGLAMAGGGE